jgi:hypothetical protein
MAQKKQSGPLETHRPINKMTIRPSANKGFVVEHPETNETHALGSLAMLKEHIKNFLSEAKEKAEHVGRMLDIPGQTVAGLEGHTPGEYIEKGIK